MELQVDYRIGGKPRYFLSSGKRSLMQIPDEIRKCVAFICYKTPERIKLAGTAFFGGVENKELGYAFIYVVTAKHVIEGIRSGRTDQKAYLRLNFKDSGFRNIETDIDQWVLHPDPFVDVAVLPWTPPPNIDYLFYPLSSAVTDDVIEKEEIGVGDEVFLVGLFVKHYGEQRNIPIVRVGNIATMPEEPVKTKMGLMDAYLIEARSIGGISGSPVFVHLDQTRTVEGPVFYLLGLMHGHWDLPISDTDETIQDDLRKKGVNMGIAIVVPVSKILETINQPHLVEVRRQTEEKIRKEAMPTLDHISKPYEE